MTSRSRRGLAAPPPTTIEAATFGSRPRNVGRTRRRPVRPAQAREIADFALKGLSKKGSAPAGSVQADGVDQKGRRAVKWNLARSVRRGSLRARAGRNRCLQCLCLLCAVGDAV